MPFPFLESCAKLLKVFLRVTSCDFVDEKKDLR